MTNTLRYLQVVPLMLLAANAVAHDEHRPPLLGALYPQISRDGGTVAFAHQGAIWTIPTRGGRMTRRTSSEGFDNWPAWSPDGVRIAYVNGRGSHIGPVKMLSVESGADLKLANAPVAKHKLAFSSDGKQLLSLFRRQGGRFELCWFNTEQGTLGEKLYADAWGLRYGVSPDGRLIALATNKDVPGEQTGNNGPQCDIWTMPASGGVPEKLVEFPGRIYDICWSADRKSLMVVSNLGGAHNDLWQIPLDAPVRGAAKITFGQADEDVPSVDARGHRFVFTDNRRGPTALVVRNLQTSRDSLITVSHRDFRSLTGKLSLIVRDAGTDALITARISLQHEAGKYHAPPNAIYHRLTRGTQALHFYGHGRTPLQLPAGRYSITVARGPEYLVERREIVVPPAGTAEETILLERWTNQKSAGWYSGESHIHANYGYGEWYNSPRTMLTQSAGEDLVVSNFMVANSDSDGVFDRKFFRGQLDPLSNEDTLLYWNQEFRSTIWGHLALLDLKRLIEPIFTGFARTTHPHDHPTNADIADLTHDQQGHVNYTHPAHNVKDPYLSAYSAKALPVDVALGKVDSIDVMGSNHEANMVLWYRLLNCGFRIPASAGTDCFLNRVRSRLPGQVRVYVRVDGNFTYQRWIESLKAGRTFVTDGPMLDFTVNGELAGSTIDLSAGATVKVHGRVRSRHPLNQVDIVSNGKVLDTKTLVKPSRNIEIDREIPMHRSGWIAIRATGPAHLDQPEGTPFGHTSPVYINVADRPIMAKADAGYFVQWIDRLRADIRKRNRVPRRHIVHVESQLAAARAVFARLQD